MIEFYLFFSTVCFFMPDHSTDRYNRTSEEMCVKVDIVRISTSPITQHGETRKTICDLTGIHEFESYNPCEFRDANRHLTYLDYHCDCFPRNYESKDCYRGQVWERCRHCGIKRRKVTEEKWEAMP